MEQALQRVGSWRWWLVGFGLALAVLGPVRAQPSDTVGVYLTWQADPATTMTVNWVDLYEEGPTNVWYRVRGDSEWLRATGARHQVHPSVLRVRRVHLTALKPDTEYEFVLSGKSPDERWRRSWFRTMPTELRRPLRFVTGGDMMHERRWLDDMNARAGALDPDFAVLGGDLAYANGVAASRWIDWIQSWHREARGLGGRLIPMVVVIGNHEVRGFYNGRIPDDAPYFYGLFALPAQRSYHALDFGNYLSFVVLDTGHTQEIGGTQTIWLRDALAARQGQRFLFPVYHYPAYGSLKRTGEALPSESGVAPEIRANWVPLFEEFGVTAVFENDHHAYKRTYPLRKDARDDGNGIVYLGDGAWGVGTRPMSGTPIWYIERFEAKRHLYQVTLHPQGLVDIAAIDAEGAVFDRLTLGRERTVPTVP